MVKKTITKYVVELLLPQEERDKFKANPKYGKRTFKRWNGEGKVYVKGNPRRYSAVSLTLDLNDATSFTKLEDAVAYSYDASYNLYFTHPYGRIYYPTRVIEVEETRVALGYASNVYKYKYE